MPFASHVPPPSFHRLAEAARDRERISPYKSAHQLTISAHNGSKLFPHIIRITDAPAGYEFLNGAYDTVLPATDDTDSQQQPQQQQPQQQQRQQQSPQQRKQYSKVGVETVFWLALVQGVMIFLQDMTVSVV